MRIGCASSSDVNKRGSRVETLAEGKSRHLFKLWPLKTVLRTSRLDWQIVQARDALEIYYEQFRGIALEPEGSVGIRVVGGPATPKPVDQIPASRVHVQTLGDVGAQRA
ncbi:MAG: hypothetical protein ABIL06_22350 [Pseudomonadota bacterium]